MGLYVAIMKVLTFENTVVYLVADEYDKLRYNPICTRLNAAAAEYKSRAVGANRTQCNAGGT